MVKEFKEGRLGAKKNHTLLFNFRVYSSHAIHDRFYQLINNASLNRFKYPDRPDYSKINADRKKMDLELLFNRKEFVLRIENIYAMEETESLEKTHILDFYKIFMRRDESEHIDNNITIAFRSTA